MKTNKNVRLVASVILIMLIPAICIAALTPILIQKSENRYYILQQYLSDNPEKNNMDVQVFGSCHSYTSFDPIYFEEQTGVGAFDYGNASEIIPTTYVRMADQFRKHIPKVALVEIWGINPQETYYSAAKILGHDLPNNLMLAPLSKEKLEVISDFNDNEYAEISLLTMNVPFWSFKDRLLDGTLTDVDFKYSFAGTKPYCTDDIFRELSFRLTNNGFWKNASSSITDYPDKQNTVEEGYYIEIDEDLVKYLLKIIELCKKNDVELIFYRAPYVSNETELGKLNQLSEICEENDVLFIDLEKEVVFDYSVDFLDYEHLSETGADKATAHLIQYIEEALNERGISTGQKEVLPPSNLLSNSTFSCITDAYNESEQSFPDAWNTEFPDDTVEITEDGVRITNQCISSGWHLYQQLECEDTWIGETLTATFDLESVSGTGITAMISCRDANNEEIMYSGTTLQIGRTAVSCPVPIGTQSIRVGFYADEGVEAGDGFAVNTTALYSGIYSIRYICSLK